MKKYNKAKRKMINFDDVTKENIKKNQNWLKIHYHLCTISITVGSESGKTNSSFNVISH